jgi:hypothetical protein
MPWFLTPPFEAAGLEAVDILRSQGSAKKMRRIYRGPSLLQLLLIHAICAVD